MPGDSKRVRILHINAGNLYGGIERLLITLAADRHLCPEMEPAFATCFEGRLADELRATGAAVHILGDVRLSRPWTTWRARRRLRDLLENSPRFDIAITHGSWLHTAFAPAVRRTDVPLWFWAHDTYFKLSRVDRAAARTRPDYVIANSHFTLGTVPALFPGVSGEVLYCPVAPAPPMDRAGVRIEVRQEFDCPPGRTVIFMGARLERWKGHSLLLEALWELKQRGGQADWEAWIAGGPQRPHEQVYFDELKTTAQRLDLGGQVRWLGQRKDMPRLLAAADIHCQPNTGPEPFGIGFIEAMQAGLPVVTTRLGAAPEIIDDTCGILTAPDDAPALAAALEALATPANRGCITGGPARANLLCDPAQQLKRLHLAIVRNMQDR